MCRLLCAGSAIAALTLLAPQSDAALISFNLSYSGAGFGNGATAVGTITFDDAVLPNPGSLANVPAASLGIDSFSITVTGASSGNGTFGLADVDNWVWILSAPLNLNAELVGQAGFSDFNWCAAGFIGCTAPAPGGIAAFTIQTNAETGDALGLVSMTPVPEPVPVALVGIALVGLGLKGLRKRA
jgi:hypothetical protein